MEGNGTVDVAIIAGSEGTTSPTVHVDIDETRHDRLPPKISRAFRGLATPNPGDPTSIDAQPAGPEDLTSAYHRSCGDDVLAHSVSVTLRKPAGAAGLDRRGRAQSRAK